MIRTWTPESDNPSPTSPGAVDYRTVKAWFQQCRDQAAVVDAQRQKIRRLRDIAEKTTPSLSGMPGGGGAGDKTGGAAAKIVDEQRELDRMEKSLDDLLIEATRRAYSISGTKSSKRQAECICLFYVHQKKQREICEELGLQEENQVSTYIKWGCAHLAKEWDKFHVPDMRPIWDK